MTSIEGIDVDDLKKNPTRQLLHHEQTANLDDFLLYRAGVGAETMRA
jgi:hypothetical protein